MPSFNVAWLIKYLQGMSHICEIYTDDVLLYGATDDEYRDNTRKVLTRLRDGKVTANPEKTELGLDEVEYVGHLISKSTRSVYKSWTFPSLRLRKRLTILYSRPCDYGI